VLSRSASITAVAFVATWLTLSAGPAGADASTFGRTVAQLPFTSARASSSTGAQISIHYQDEHDPNAKPKTFHKLEIALPEGTRLDTSVVPACEADDSTIMAQGPSACPQESKVGDGTVTLLTGFGPPTDPFATDVTVFQGRGELLDVFSAHGSSQTLAVDHVKIEGRTLIDEPQSVPGGPPDGRSAPRDVNLRIGARTAGDGRAYLTTPPSCPRGGRWESRFSVSYDDGVNDLALATTPCSATAQTRARPSIRVAVAPRRVRAGKRVRFRFRVRSSAPGCQRGALVRFAGRRARTNRRGRAALVVRLRRTGRRRAVVSKRGCRRGVATVIVTPR
jgi:hypothetical protein